MLSSVALSVAALGLVSVLVDTDPASTRANESYDTAIERARAATFNDPAAALVHADNAIALANIEENPSDYALALWIKSDALTRLGKPAAAHELINLARDNLENPRSGLAGRLDLTDGRALSSLGRSGDALLSLQRAYGIFERNGETEGMAKALTGIGVLLLEAGRYEHALEAFDEAAGLEVADDLAFAIDHNRAGIHRDLGAYDIARSLFEKNLERVEGSGSPYLLGSTLILLADAEVKSGNLEKAKEYQGRAAVFEGNPSFAPWRPFLGMVDAKIAMAEGDLRSADLALDLVFRGYDFENPSAQLTEIHQAAFDLYEKTGRTADALKHLKALKAAQSSTDRQMAKSNFALLNAEFLASRKDLEIERLQRSELETKIEADRRATRLKILAATIGSVGAAGLALLLGLHLSAERKAAKKLAASNSSLKEALETKTRFLASTSHEIRTPLNAILGMGHVMLEEEQDHSRLARTKTIVDAGELLLSIVNDILDVAKMEKGGFDLDLRPTSLSDVVEPVAELHRSANGQKGVALETDYDENHGLYETDARLVTQAVGNLIANAFKFTEAGTIAVRAHRLPEYGFEVEVKDTGIGIPAEEIDRIFESFRQVDGSATRQYGGTGLGLAIVKNIAEALGGTISVKSEVGQGSCFVMRIPARYRELTDTEEAFRRRNEEPRSRPHAMTQVRVLVAEDNEVNQLVMTTILANEVGYLEVVKNGLEAVQRAAERQFDVILMDHHMPVMSGLEATKAIKRLEDIPIIGVTADVGQEVHRTLLDAGMNSIVTKPFAKEMLLNAIEGSVLMAPTDRSRKKISS
jgi:signal transduction histidine kinase/CheY-like chemotaxis protein